MPAVAKTIEVYPNRGFRGEGRNNLRNDAKGRKNQDIHLWMTKEPENMLEHHRITAPGGVKEGGAKMAVREEHRHRTGQHWHSSDQ